MKGMNEKKICRFCGREFSRREKLGDWHWRHQKYCGKKCRKAWYNQSYFASPRGGLAKEKANYKYYSRHRDEIRAKNKEYYYRMVAIRGPKSTWVS